MRVYLAGSIWLERGDVRVPETRFPGRQGRLAFALLAAEHRRAVTREELAEELWGEAPPRAWDTALRAIVSKLRALLSEVGLDGETIGSAFGCYQLHLPRDAWIDLEATDDAVHRAEAEARAGHPELANGWALVANAIAARPFLPGEDTPWVERRRAQLREIRVRALECRAAVLLDTGDHPLAARDAEAVTHLEPFRETGYALLMRAHAGGGNPAEALRVYERCRRLVGEELGVTPSPDLEQLYLDILRRSSEG
ncbi:MAG TPA: BTAD domain-containing putative transcriptional regulator [Actinomycetota bacterium]